MTYGLLFDYEYCTNCGSCQVSCQEEHDYPADKTGIKIVTDGPWRIDDEYWNFNNYPLITDLCDMCEERTSKGREPLCVHHCLANIITYGTVEELAKKLNEKPKQLLFVPSFKPLTKKQYRTGGLERRHTAAHIDVSVTGEASIGVHRHDAKVGSISENDSTF